MPITRSAKKALRRDRRRTKINKLVRLKVKKAVKLAKSKISTTNLQAAFRELDRAAKKHVLHANKAARLKSRLARHFSLKSSKPPKSPKPLHP